MQTLDNFGRFVQYFGGLSKMFVDLCRFGGNLLVFGGILLALEECHRFWNIFIDF